MYDRNIFLGKSSAQVQHLGGLTHAVAASYAIDGTQLANSESRNQAANALDPGITVGCIRRVELVAVADP